MPLKLIPPRPGRTPYYHIRGTYLGVYCERSVKSGEAAIAKKLKKHIEREIERGAFAGSGELGFAAAAAAYMKAGGERNYLAPLIEHFKTTPLSSINQQAIDTAAAAIYPMATAATRNRQVYTPISAVLKRAGHENKIKRPKGWRGQRLTHWLRPDQAFAIFKATARIDAPKPTRIAFRVFLRLLCYTGMRLGDALGLQCQDIDLDASSALLKTTKNGKPRLVYLPRIIVDDLRLLPDGLDRDGRVFRFHNGGRLRDLLKDTLALAGVTLPRRVAFHVFCHTWATWMRQHGGLDTFDLLKTDRWSDAESADRYAHVVVSDQAKKADMLPVEPKRRRAR